MDLRQLRALVAVADHESFSAAARSLHTVQSNVSTHIARLERELRVTLVDRANGQLTPEGLVVVARAFARIFLQNSINLGLATVICPTIEASEDDELSITAAEVANETTGRRFAVVPLPAARQAIIEAGGLIPYTRQLVVAAQGR
jgi:molybdenum-dependent DNA-binding transcriptional regulator ModE